jgi:glycerol-3-phosphate acyltransferase PlsY
LNAALQVLAAYLLGAVPTAYVAGKLRGLDIRQHGSGNVGATNVFRVLGRGPGAVVLLIDIAKGWAASYLLPYLLAPSGAAAFMSGAPERQAWWPCLLGLVAVLGHSYTCFLAFKGGKGVATSAGVFLGLAPYATLAVFAVFIIAFLATRMVSVGSLLSALCLPLLVMGFKEWRPAAAKLTVDDFLRSGWEPLARPVFYLAVLLAVLVWVKHIPNIRRILSGTENKFTKTAGA